MMTRNKADDERIAGLRAELSLLPKFVAEAIQCNDADTVARLFVTLSDSAKSVPNFKNFADFGFYVGSHIAAIIREYTENCVSNWRETHPANTSDEIAVLTALIARYRSDQP